MIKILWSILNCNYCKLYDEINIRKDYIDGIHIDIFDGQFVPTYSFNKNIIENIRDNFQDLYIDCHLAVLEPKKWINDLIKYKVNRINIHYESFENEDKLIEILKNIKENNIETGIVLDINTSYNVIIDKYIEYVDQILIMTIKAGYSSLNFQSKSLLKIKKLKEKYKNIKISVDGGINLNNYQKCINIEADTLICGSLLLNKNTFKDIIKKMKETEKEKINYNDWKNKETLHTPNIIIDEKLSIELRKLGTITTIDEINKLKEKLEEENNLFMILGDCSEDINYNINEHTTQLKKTYEICNDLLKEYYNIIPLYRGCGQIIKPRTNKYEKINGKEENVFWGNNINTYEDRRINKELLKKGLLFSKECYKKIEKGFISHEALLIEYEDILTKEENNKFYNLSSHMLWVGNKTRQLSNKQIEYLKHIENPIGIKIDINIDIDELNKIIEKLNPLNENNKILLILRIGNDNDNNNIEEFINKIIHLNVLWFIDPMHGNTKIYNDEKKVRYIEDIKEELVKITKILRLKGKNVKGIMFESIYDKNVKECLFKNEKIENRIYTSLCDPRINSEQLKYVLKDFNKNYGNICLILAKKGSIGLPNKNKMRLLSDDIPLYLRCYNNIKKENHFDEIYISTNDMDIIYECKKRDINYIYRDDTFARNDKYVDSVYFTINEIIKREYIPNKIAICMCVQPYFEKNIFNKMKNILDLEKCDSVITLKDSVDNIDWVLKKSLNKYPILISQNNGNITRSKNIYFEIDNAIVYFTYNSVLYLKSELPWPYLGNKIIGIKQEFENKNFICDINYNEDLVWANFLNTYNNWYKNIYLKEKIKNYESGMFSDLLDEYNLRNQVITNFKINNKKLKYLGKIRTILIKDKNEISNYKDENIYKGLSFINKVKNDEVIIVKSSNNFAYHGKLMTNLCLNKNIQGIIIDGLTRDSVYTSESTFPIHSRGYSPIDIKNRGCVYDTDIEFKIEETIIKPYDYVYGDNDGIVIIPKELFENNEFQEKIEKTLKDEEDIIKLIKNEKGIEYILKNYKSF